MSRAAKGSSSNNILGFPINDKEIANFFFCPPDKFLAFKSSVFYNSKSPREPSLFA